MGDKYRSFNEMQKSLRAGAAAGMNAVITLEPESAIHLAEILEAHNDTLISDLADAVATATLGGKGQ